MTEYRVEVVKLGKFGKHPNADTLSIISIFGRPCIFRTGDFQVGDLAVYVPVDAEVPIADERFAFLAKGVKRDRVRIKALRLRGIFSMGLLVKAEPEWVEGQLVHEELNITKHDPEAAREGSTGGRGSGDTGKHWMPIYDLEGLPRWPDAIRVGESVYITEKIHGCNARFCKVDGELRVMSRTRVRLDQPGCVWWQIAKKYDLENKLGEGEAIYGEVYGLVQDLTYGVAGFEFRVFDVYDMKAGRFFDVAELEAFAAAKGLPLVPVLYRGPWSEPLRGLAEGTSTIAGHVREGFVVRPVKERFDDNAGRCVFKMVGEGYHLRKQSEAA
jgi:RNA ligase (TIGR02306 family)